MYSFSIYNLFLLLLVRLISVDKRYLNIIFKYLSCDKGVGIVSDKAC